MITPDEKTTRELMEMARKLGASDAVAIPAEKIFVNPELARYCSDGRCKGYGASMHCPPHGMDPAGFRKLLAGYRDTLAIRIDAPTDRLLGDGKAAEFEKLHAVAAGLESFARRLGFPQALAFAGGSCREIFCPDEACRGLENDGSCRHPHSARPSMSGLGIDVFRLMETAGWKADRITGGADPDTVPVAGIVGLVLLR